MLRCECWQVPWGCCWSSSAVMYLFLAPFSKAGTRYRWGAMRKRPIQPALNRNYQASLVLFTKQGSESKPLRNHLQLVSTKQMSWEMCLSFPWTTQSCPKPFQKKHTTKRVRCKLVTECSHCAGDSTGNKYFCEPLKISQYLWYLYESINSHWSLVLHGWALVY